MSSHPTMVGAVADGRVHPTAHAQRLTQWCAGTACGIALVALAGWVLDVRFLAGQWGTYLPIPPSGALGLLILGGGIFCQARWPSRAWGRRVALAGASLPALLGLWVLVEFASGYNAGLEVALARTGEMLGHAALGRMSPISAASLLLESLALVLMLHLMRWRGAAALAVLLAGLATLTHLVVLVGYLYGAPLLYGGPVRAVALPAALAFVLLGAGQIHLLLPRISALEAWQRGTTRGNLLGAFLPFLLMYIVLDGWADAWREGFFGPTNPALWHALLALAIGGLFVPVVAWVARRTGDEIGRAHLALRASDERYRLAVNATNDGMWDVNFRDGTAHFNESYVAAFGRPSEHEEPWDWWTDRVHPDDRERTLASFNAAVNGSDDVWKCEYRFRRIDGSWASTSDRAHIERDSTGKAQYIIGALSDVTDRERTEESLRTSKHYLDNILNASGDPIFVKDSSFRFVLANDALCTMLGMRREDIIGKTLGESLPEDQMDHFLEVDRMVLESGQVNQCEEPLTRRDGTILTIVTKKTRYVDELGQAFVVGVIRDITDRKRGEEDKARLEAQLQQSQKMESVGRLAGGVAHDFNNMLGVILGHSELALQQVDPVQPLHADLQQIHSAALRSADLTRQLLAFARKQPVAPRILDLNDAVGGMLKMLHRLIGENIALTWQPEADLWPVKVDPSQIDQILANLCVNARDAISGVGRITIEAGNGTIDEGCCAAQAGCEPGEYVRLAVSDDGSGMDAETVAHIFEPFFTTKGIGEGTGLGLATVYGIVKQNNGFIDVASEPGRGTTFTIHLPRHVGNVEQAGTNGTAGPMPRGHETILLVEDEPSILTLTTRLLERQGYTVLAASTPAEATSLARQHTGEINLLITDVIMPEMNGRVLARNVLSLRPHVKCLFMSGYTADVITHDGVLDERTHFIQKPFSTEALATKVRDALDAQN